MESDAAVSAHGATTTAEWIRSLLEKHESALLRYATRMVGGDVERARDIVQDTFLRLCQRPRDEVADHAVEWLFTVCRNRALDVRRKEGRMKTFGDANPTDSHESRAPAPLELLERGETADRILEIYGSLSDNQQEVLRLKFQGGLSYKEISRVTELTVSNVGFLIHTALKTIRRKMKADSGLPSSA